MCNLQLASDTPTSSTEISTNIFKNTLKKITKRTRRYKIWELEPRYHCSVIGTCLTLKELRQLAPKAGLEAKTMTDYELHVSFVHILDQKCYPANLLNKLLDKKYRHSIAQFAKEKDEAGRNKLWQQTLKSGNVSGIFWALVSHPECSEKLGYKAFGDIHMLSHLSGASVRIDQQELIRLKQQNQELEQQRKQVNIDTRKKSSKKDREISALKKQLLDSEKKNKRLALAAQELDEIKNTSLATSLRAQLDKLNSLHSQSQSCLKRTERSEQIWMQRARKEQDNAIEIKQQLVKVREEKQVLESTLAHLLEKRSDIAGNCSTCPNSNDDLCGRCVLYIGGRNRQNSHFKELVEQQNGQFIHHDGGREDSYHRLANIVSQADVVLCPMDCVSHAAMNTVKRHCEHHTKRLIFIPHASLSSFAKGLEEVVN